MNNPNDNTNVDLSTCANEPIHIIGRIQSFGYLLAFSSDWIIQHASVNCRELFGLPVEELLGSRAIDFLPEAALHEIRSRLQMLGGSSTVDRIFGLNLTGSGQLYDVAVHASGRSFIIEAEPAALGRTRDTVSYVRPMIDRMRQAGTLEDLCRQAARNLRALTGFDRVMVYRFEHDGAGEVIAESRNGSVDSFMGLHFPASDIPAQARRLYTRNLLRIISDIDDPTVPIVPPVNPRGEPLDLTMSGLRAVSPIHIEYLRNMGVKASMSVSIIKGDALWGLIACHHYAPLRLDYSVRTSCELFGQFMSFLLEQTDLREINAHRATAIRLHDEIMARLAPGAGMMDAFDGFRESIGKVIAFDSIAGWIGGELVGHGKIPDKQQFARLARFLNTAGASQVWHTDNLASVYPGGADLGEDFAGLMALPVSRRPRDYIVLFRKAHEHSVSWAGNPQKSVEYGPNGARLTPRKSFELWKEDRKGFSIPWTDEERVTADSLRITLLEVVLRMNDAAEQERTRAEKKQETLIAELNHRVRNILSLIRGLVSLSRDAAQSADMFAEVVRGRIYALSRAHDLVTKLNWGPASLEELLRVETKAYVGDKLDRVQINGIDVLIEPAAFSAIALVFHELTTNSCKYGALSDSSGNVSVVVSQSPGSGIDIDWIESGGPEVKPPQRRGFGSTIIESSIPHELGGTALVQYEPTGLRAHFSIPAHHVASIVGRRSIGPAVTESPMEPDVAEPLWGDVLIVEDNFIIASEADAKLRALGADRCHVTGRTSVALEIIGRVDLTFALLDVNLGTETSVSIAEELTRKRVPFIVASGYGDDIRGNSLFSSVITLAKPYNISELRLAIQKIFHDR